MSRSSTESPDGGIGRRASFRYLCRKAWRFKSSSGHHFLSVLLMADIILHEGDLPSSKMFSDSVAVDTETMGLNLHRDKLCLIQLCGTDGICHLVRFSDSYDAPNLKKVLSDPKVLKIFHFARFDLAAIYKYLGVACAPVYCTKIASKLTRTNAPSHSLKTLCEELLGVVLDKEMQTSDWSADTLSERQKKYAANDVLYLHAIKKVLDERLKKNHRQELASSCFNFLNTRAVLDLNGWDEPDIFAH